MPEWSQGGAIVPPAPPVATPLERILDIYCFTLSRMCVMVSLGCVLSHFSTFCSRSSRKLIKLYSCLGSISISYNCPPPLPASPPGSQIPGRPIVRDDQNSGRTTNYVHSDRPSDDQQIHFNKS